MDSDSRVFSLHVNPLWMSQARPEGETEAAVLIARAIGGDVDLCTVQLHRQPRLVRG